MVSSSSNPHTDLVPGSLQVLTTLLLVDPGAAIPWSPARNRGSILIDPSILSQCRQPRTLGFLPHSLPASSHEVQKVPTSGPLHMLFSLSGTLFSYAFLLMDSSSVCRLWLGCQWDTSCPPGSGQFPGVFTQHTASPVQQFCFCFPLVQFPTVGQLHLGRR